MTPRQVAWYELFYLRRFSVTLQKIVLPEVTRLLQERLLDSQTQVLTHLAKYRDQRGQKVNRQMGKKAKRGKYWSLHLFDICVCIFIFLYLPNTMAQHSKGE